MNQSNVSVGESDVSMGHSNVKVDQSNVIPERESPDVLRQEEILRQTAVPQWRWFAKELLLQESH